MPSGVLYPRSASSSSEAWPFVQRGALVAGLGAGIVLIHVAVRLPLQLPGRQGVAAIALLLLARWASGMRWGATAAGAAALLAAGVSFSVGPLTAASYLLGGLIIDTAFRLAPRASRRTAFAALVGAIANSTQVLPLWVAVMGWSSAAGHFGARPLVFTASHLAFGAAGGVLAALLWRWRAGGRSSDGSRTPCV